MKLLITGAAGFIGSHLTERLLDAGHNVVGLDNFDDFYAPKIKQKNIAHCLKNKKFQLIKGDIRDSETVEKIVSNGIETIIHLAAKAGVRPSIAMPLLYADVNINGTMTMLEAAKKFNIPKFIFASSSSVYGNNEKVPFSENDNVDYPISPYAATKKACELICHTYHHLYCTSISCLRLFTVYGPRQRPDLAIHKFAKLIKTDNPIEVYGDGNMSRDFTYIDDIIDGIIAAIDRCNGFNIYNLGESNTITVNDLIAAIEKTIGKKALKNYAPAQPGDVIRTFADIRKAREQLGYDPKTTIEQGLAKFYDWFKTQ